MKHPPSTDDAFVPPRMRFRPHGRLDPATLALGGLLVLPAAGTPVGPVVVLMCGHHAAHVATAEAVRSNLRDPATSINCEGSSFAARQALEGARPGVIVAIGVQAARFAHAQAPATPLVYCYVPDAERQGLSGPGITGVSAEVAPGAELSALRQAAPGIRSVLLVRDSVDEARAAAVRAVVTQAKLGMFELPVGAASELSAGVRALLPESDAVWLTATRVTSSSAVFRYLLARTLATRKPMLVFSESLVHAGALVAVAPDEAWIGARAAELANRIRRGVKPVDLPVVALQGTRVVTNPATAHALRLDASPQSADGVEIAR